ncbi:hypothetical protein TREES_T100004948 [Tupaia chinensis]|uniref:Uncharacterized protein n=1 Tax=Tupaia chinensis TaxID=246437 RepID=L9LDN7_TUPCH|nr:hypothetical protein TREES_T100004948 [Tupaia chinensis]
MGLISLVPPDQEWNTGFILAPAEYVSELFRKLPEDSCFSNGLGVSSQYSWLVTLNEEPENDELQNFDIQAKSLSEEERLKKQLIKIDKPLVEADQLTNFCLKNNVALTRLGLKISVVLTSLSQKNSVANQ